MDPTQLLLPEIWEQVFDRLEEDAQDWLNLLRSSSRFEEVVGGKRSDALFRQVLSHCWEYLELQDLLALRLVSHKWKGAVDSKLGDWKDETDADHYEDCRERYDFKTLSVITSFLDKFESHPGNPVICKSVSVDYLGPFVKGGGGDLMEYSSAASRLLLKFGKPLTHLSFTDLITELRGGFDTFAARLRALVEQTPVLESMYVIYGVKPGLHAEFEEMRIPPIETDLAAGPPLIPKLKSLHFLELGREGNSAFGAHLEAGILRMLACNPGVLESVRICGGLPSALIPFPNLNDAYVILRGIEDFHKLLQTSWPLTRLSLRSVSQSIDNRQMLQLAEHFSQSLTDLTLFNACKEWRVTGESSGAPFKLHLPHLKRLELQAMSTFIPFHTFTELANLEELKLENNYPSERGVNRFFDIIRLEMDESKLFGAMPSLRKVVAEGVHVSEETGEAFGFGRVYLRSAFLGQKQK